MSQNAQAVARSGARASAIRSTPGLTRSRTLRKGEVGRFRQTNGSPVPSNVKARAVMNALLADFRLTVRLLSRSPAFSLTVVLVMALGIGANSAIFTALDQTVIRPLPYRDPDRLATVWEDYSSISGMLKNRVSPATFLDWRRRTQTFADLAAYGAVTTNLSGTGAPEQIFGQRVT